MRSVVLGLFTLMCVVSAQAQTDGDYRTAKVSGNWSDADMWETRAAGAWAITATAPTASNSIFLQTGHALTVDVATASCKDLNMTPTGVGSTLIIGANVLQVNGKMRAYAGTAVTGAADGVFYSSQTLVITGFASASATTTTGVLRIVGATRTVFTTGEWGASGFSGCDIEFKLDNGAVASTPASFKFKNVTVTSGSTVDAGSTARIQADNTGATGNITIKSGGRIMSARSAVGSQVFCGNSSTTKCGTVTIENGATLELGGQTPAIDCTTFTNDGTVIYNKAGTQTLLQRGADATATTAFNAYKNLILGGTSTKTPFAAITVSTLLQFTTGTATFAPTAVLTLTMLNGSTVDRGVTSGTSLPSTVGAVLYGTTATDLVNVTISSSLSNSNELPSAQTPGKVGTLTINSGVTYTITGGRAVTDLVNNNIVALAPSTTMTLTINGNISGSGTITGHTNASVTFGGSNSGSAGTLNFTSGSQIANNLTMNRTGVNASVTLGTPVTLNATTGILNLTSGKIILGTNNLTTGATLITGGNSTSYVVTNGAGKLIQPHAATVAKTYPVGVSTYDPVMLTPVEAITFSVAVKDAISNTLSNRAGNTALIINREWDIKPEVGTPITTKIDLTADPLAPNLDGSFTRSTGAGVLGHFNTMTNVWEDFAATYASNTWTIAAYMGTYSPFITASTGAVLSVELSDFKVKANQKSALLTWTTASEKDNAYFDVQHSTNGADFQTIGQVNGSGTRTVATTYSFDHKDPSVGVNYYRLNQVDANGKATLSAVRSVVMGKTGLVVKTTLVTDVLEIVVSDEKIGPLSIFNISGQNVLNFNAQGTKQLSVSNLPAGLYFIRTATGDIGRFVKQ
jgi:hypothetical protein